MSKVKMTNVMKKRLRTTLDCSKPVLTDQSWVKSQNINNIMEKYSKTGVLPQTRQNLAQYLDVSEVPSLEQAHDMVIEARNMFMELPADVRKLMDNDPNKLHEFCSDPSNQEYLIERGVLDKIGKAAQGSTAEASISKPQTEQEAQKSE
jgi:hypothetical protein